MKGLDFLKKASLVANEVVKPAVARTTTAKNRNPENADIRVYRDGSVYPSAALVTEFNLAYVGKDVAPKGQAFDVFESAKYINTQSWEDKVLFIAAVDRSLPKTDLFSGSKYDENGEPTADVLTQGANTFGKELLTMLKDTYGIEIAEDAEQNYIDLVILRDIPFNTPDNIYYVPKVVSRGNNKGQSDLVRRENITLYPLVTVEAYNELNAQPEAIEEPVAEIPVKAPKATPAAEAEA